VTTGTDDAFLRTEIIFPDGNEPRAIYLPAQGKIAGLRVAKWKAAWNNWDKLREEKDQKA